MLMHSETYMKCKYSTVTKKCQICKWNIQMNILYECIYIKFKIRQNLLMVIVNQSISRLIGKIKVALPEMIRTLYFVLRSGHKCICVCVCVCVCERESTCKHIWHHQAVKNRQLFLCLTVFFSLYVNCDLKSL